VVHVGGLVEMHSLARGPDGRQFSFRVTDGASNLAVVYEGLLPDLFREGQGVVAEGKLGPDGVFAATTVLAKHDENYMPPAAADAIKQAQSVNAQSINEKATHTLVGGGK